MIPDAWESDIRPGKKVVPRPKVPAQMSLPLVSVVLRHQNFFMANPKVP
jgi:hypothetical protein